MADLPCKSKSFVTLTLSPSWIELDFATIPVRGPAGQIF